MRLACPLARRLLLAALIPTLLVARPAMAQTAVCRPARTALVLAGGGSKGLSHIGLLQALDSLGVRPDLIVGTSMGAILGALYASGESGKEIEAHIRATQLEQMIRSYEPVVSASLGGLKPVVVWEREPTHWVLQTGTVREADASALLSRLVLRANLAARGDFDSLPIPFRAVATDLDDRSVVSLGKGDLARALRASMAIPLMLRPVVIDGRTLVDGGLSANVPVRVARAMGAERIIVSTIASPKPDPAAFDDPITVTSAVFEYLWVQDTGPLGDEDVLIAQPTARYGMIDFHEEIIDSLIVLGRRTADAAFAAAKCVMPLARGPIVAQLPDSVGRARIVSANVRDRDAVLRSLALSPHTAIDPARISTGLGRFTSQERYRGLWLNPSGDSLRANFDVIVDPAPRRSMGLGFAFDHTMSGRVWMGAVDRNLFARDLEGTALLTAGLYRSDLTLAARRRARVGRRYLPVGGSVEFITEDIRVFDGPAELPSLDTEEAAVVIGLRPLFEPGWSYEFGGDYRLLRNPGVAWHGTAGARYAVRYLREGTPDPIVDFRIVALGEWQEAHLRLQGTDSIGHVSFTPRVRAAWGRRLPVQHSFALGGLDGFAGLRMTELRGDHELFGSLLVRWPLFGWVSARVEPMVGKIGVGEFFDSTGFNYGGRIGVDFDTPVGPIRIEQGFSNGDRRQALIRVGHWF